MKNLREIIRRHTHIPYTLCTTPCGEDIFVISNTSLLSLSTRSLFLSPNHPLFLSHAYHSLSVCTSTLCCHHPPLSFLILFRRNTSVSSGHRPYPPIQSIFTAAVPHSLRRHLLQIQQTFKSAFKTIIVSV